MLHWCEDGFCKLRSIKCSLLYRRTWNVCFYVTKPEDSAEHMCVSRALHGKLAQNLLSYNNLFPMLSWIEQIELSSRVEGRVMELVSKTVQRETLSLLMELESLAQLKYELNSLPNTSLLPLAKKCLDRFTLANYAGFAGNHLSLSFSWTDLLSKLIVEVFAVLW